MREESNHLPIELVNGKTHREKKRVEYKWKLREEKMEEYHNIFREKWENRRVENEEGIERKLENLMGMTRGAAEEAGMRNKRKKGGLQRQKIYSRKEERRVLKKYRKTKKIEDRIALIIAKKLKNTYKTKIKE